MKPQTRRTGLQGSFAFGVSAFSTRVVSAAVEAQADEIKARYVKIFKV
jgi:hypothetical protein